VFPLRLLPFIVAGVLPAAVAGCRSTAPAGETSATVSSDAHYAFLFGQRYRTSRDLYLFAFTQEPAYRYLGTRADGFALGPKELPAAVTTENIGKIYQRSATDGMGDVIIADVVPVGAALTVRAETHEVTFLSGVRGSGGYPMGFIADAVFAGKTNSVLTEFIQSHATVTGKAPNQDISSQVAEKIP